MNNQSSGYLLLEDGTRFNGHRFIGKSYSLGEAVFNTSHSGYQEILSDPSYSKQLMVFTTPHIGNVGVNEDDIESDKVHVAGLAVKSLSLIPRNYRSEQDLQSWLSNHNTPILIGANTRAITLHLRDRGAMRAGIFPDSTSERDAIELVHRSPEMNNLDLAKVVGCQDSYEVSDSICSNRWHLPDPNGSGLHIAVLDFGVKRNILRELKIRSCDVTVLPGNTTSTELLKGKFDGVLLSNGPGDPSAVTYGVNTIQALIGNIPMFGICLGHQLLALAAGIETYKLPFGHRGSNHPVLRESDKAVEITSQNHGFAVLSNNIPEEWRITHINLNDNSVEGLEHKHLPIFSIQYHPEASPGPHDGLDYFDRFIAEMRRAKA